MQREGATAASLWSGLGADGGGVNLPMRRATRLRSKNNFPKCGDGVEPRMGVERRKRRREGRRVFSQFQK